MNRNNNSFIKAYRKEEAKTNKELENQWYIMNGCAVYVLWEKFKWRKKRIVSFACYGGDVWKNVADAGTALSTLELLEQETGIELSLDGYKSYHEYSFLDHTKWDGKMPTIPQQIYIMQQQRVWMPTMLTACFCTALHRKEGWGFDRLTRFVDEMTKQRKKCRDPKWYKEHCKEKYDIDLYLEA